MQEGESNHDKRRTVNHFFNKYENSKTNVVSISQNDLENIEMTEQEIIRTIYVLQEDELINIKEKSVHDDFSRYWTVALKSQCIHYWENKRIRNTSNKRDWIRTYIPITLSIIAIIISILALVAQLIK